MLSIHVISYTVNYICKKKRSLIGEVGKLASFRNSLATGIVIDLELDNHLFLDTCKMKVKGGLHEKHAKRMYE